MRMVFNKTAENACVRIVAQSFPSYGTRSLAIRSLEFRAAFLQSRTTRIHAVSVVSIAIAAFISLALEPVEAISSRKCVYFVSRLYIQHS